MIAISSWTSDLVLSWSDAVWSWIAVSLPQGGRYDRNQDQKVQTVMTMFTVLKD